jgi:high-affinity iron transporter
MAFGIAIAGGWLLGAPAARAGDAAAGQAVFVANCAACHGPSGRGDGPVGQKLNPPPRNFAAGQFKFDTDADGKRGSEADLRNVIRKGAAAYGGSTLMAPWPTLSDHEIEDLIAYIRSL